MLKNVKKSCVFPVRKCLKDGGIHFKHFKQ